MNIDSRELIRPVVSDYRQFYAVKNAGYLSLGLGGSAMLAHTDADQEFRNWYQDSIRSEGTDRLAHLVKSFGNGRYTVPIFVGSLILTGLIEEKTPLEARVMTWAGNSLRTMLVGVPPMLLLQLATGGSRPGESDSSWHPFKDDNGVSGHSFMGAVPFLSAAKMTRNLYIKTAFYLGSTLCGLSRINDDKHYFSQVLAGWWLAYLAADSVHHVDTRASAINIMPLFIDRAAGLMVQFRF